MQSIPRKCRKCSRFLLISMELKIQRSDKFQVPLAPSRLAFPCRGVGRQKSSNLQVQVPPSPARRSPAPTPTPAGGGDPPFPPPTPGPGLRLGGRVSVPTIVRAQSHWRRRPRRSSTENSLATSESEHASKSKSEGHSDLSSLSLRPPGPGPIVQPPRLRQIPAQACMPHSPAASGITVRLPVSEALSGSQYTPTQT